MEKAILNFPQQFSYQPVITGPDKSFSGNKIVVCGMGGSALAAELLKSIFPKKEIIIHKDYGLPSLPAADQYQYIFSSYSGNTEEVINGYKKAREKKYDIAVISTGGELLAKAKKDKNIYVKLPNSNIQPRSALGYSFLAFLKLLNEEKKLKELSSLQDKLNSEQWREEGKELAQEISGYVPIIYSSQTNKAIIYNWKIKFNETGKIPAFYNTVPELNHNEMTGFDLKETSRYLSDRFYFLFLMDKKDFDLHRRRLEILFQLLTEKGLPAKTIWLQGETREERIFQSLLLADWAAFYTAQIYSLDAEQVPMVEEFKKRISQFRP